MRTVGELLSGLAAKAPQDAPAFRCAECQDRGYVGNPARRCCCYLSRPIEERLAAAGVGKDLLGASWETYRGKRPDLDSFPEPDSCLTLTGPVGTGKSHVAVAILREWLLAGGTGRYLEASQLIAECRACFERGEQPEMVLARYYRCGLRVLDDAWGDRHTELADDVLSQFVRRCLRDRLPLVITTNLTEAMLLRIEPKVASRITGAGSIAIDFTGLPDRRRAGGENGK